MSEKVKYLVHLQLFMLTSSITLPLANIRVLLVPAEVILLFKLV